MLGTADKIRTNSCGLLHMVMTVVAYVHQLCADTGCILVDLHGVMEDRDVVRERERERVSQLGALSMTR